MTDPSVRISRLDVEHAEEIARMVATTISALTYYNDRARTEEIAKYGAVQLLELSRLEPGSVLVAHVVDDAAGFCISRYDDGLVWLSWFGVHQLYRRRGIGEALLRSLAATLPSRRAHKVWCDTRTENVPSQRLLRKVGFEKTAHFRDHWYGQDFFIWEWQP